MLKKIQRATASSPEGARGLVTGVLACALQNISFMLPTGLLYFLVRDLLAGAAAGRTGFYVCGCIVCFALILLATWFQYNSTFFTTYKESGKRRLALAERLRKLPLAFFGKRDLADLTSTIMADCEVLEKTCSHFIPGLFGSLISTVLIALGLFAFDWRMALAALWVIPVSIAILLASYRVQDRVQGKTMAVKMTCADGIQEYIETLRDLKAANAENAYLTGLSDKIRAVEKQTISAELTNAVFVTSAGMVLKLGIASVALTGSVLLINGSIDVLTLFMFLLVASRLYDPIILLDEATASLDVENETLIQTALSRLIRSKTVLLIAHRMRTVAGADKIVVLADGVVAEQGAPQELYAQNGLYTHMSDLQTGTQNWTI